MEELGSNTLRAFLAEVGRRYDRPAKLLLLGGSSLYLLGSPRPTLDVDFVGDDRHQDQLQLTMHQVAGEMKVEIEAIPIEQFIPLPDGAIGRHIFIERFSNIDVYVFDPYSTALSKIERGFDSDIDDVVFLVRGGYIELSQLERFVITASEQAAEFDLNPRQMRVHVDVVRKRMEG